MSKPLLNESPQNQKKPVSGMIWGNLTGKMMIARYEKQFPELKDLPLKEKLERLIQLLKQMRAEEEQLPKAE